VQHQAKLSVRRLLRAGRQIVNTIEAEGFASAVRKIRRRLARVHRRDPFDDLLGVDTSGEVSLYELDIASQNIAAGIRYQASPADGCRRLLASLPLCHEDFCFIDLGAGKGRVLLVASEFPFKRVFGVEFAIELVEIARANIARLGCKAEIFHDDAATFSFFPDNLIVYLYNPFGPDVLKPVLRNLQSIVAVRDVYVVYVNPVHTSCFAECAEETCTIGGAKLYRIKPARMTVSEPHHHTIPL
jgi:predicted RNA methylase